MSLINIMTVIQDLASHPTQVGELTHGTLNGQVDLPHSSGEYNGQRTSPSVMSLFNPKELLTNWKWQGGLLLHERVLKAHIGPAMQLTQRAIGCDNSPTVTWTTYMATRSEPDMSYHLIKGLEMCQQITHSAKTALFHVSGVDNILADVASCPVTSAASHFHLLEKLTSFSNISHHF
jgi:hypothetical protein